MEEVLSTLDDNTNDFWVNYSIPFLDCPNAIEFLREGYSAYHPVIIRGAVNDWPALTKWSKGYIVEQLGSTKININITTDGLGDCVKPVDPDEIIDTTATSNEEINEETGYNRFVYPAECDMSINQFYDLLENTDPEYCVPYLSQQNDNLRSSMPTLLTDIKPLQFAQEAFGVDQPEAINLWIGDERSVSSVHKDHYENMYAVISGEKVFTLLPPTDVAFLPEREYKTAKYTLKKVDNDDNSIAQYHQSNIALTTQDCPSETLSWIPLDPDDPYVTQKFPSFKQCHPIRCAVLPGEILYIPAMWYHRVTQNQLTVSVNYWYDQRFDYRYVFYQTMKKVGELTINKEKQDNHDENS